MGGSQLRNLLLGLLVSWAGCCGPQLDESQDDSSQGCQPTLSAAETEDGESEPDECQSSRDCAWNEKCSFPLLGGRNECVRDETICRTLDDCDAGQECLFRLGSAKPRCTTLDASLEADAASPDGSDSDAAIEDSGVDVATYDVPPPPSPAPPPPSSPPPVRSR